jgi:hypothetical protein
VLYIIPEEIERIEYETNRYRSLQVIATYEDHDQDIFTMGDFDTDSLKSEESLLQTIKMFCKKEPLKLSLCWISDNFKAYAKNKAIKATLEKNGKYFFGAWA